MDFNKLKLRTRTILNIDNFMLLAKSWIKMYEQCEHFNYLIVLGDKMTNLRMLNPVQNELGCAHYAKGANMCRELCFWLKLGTVSFKSGCLIVLYTQNEVPGHSPRCGRFSFVSSFINGNKVKHIQKENKQNRIFLNSLLLVCWDTVNNGISQGLSFAISFWQMRRFYAWIDVNKPETISELIKAWYGYIKGEEIN